MRQSHSLEEERQALLEQIHASRITYRRMLTNSDESDETDAAHVMHNGEIVDASHKFPRSKTIRWVMDHPYLTAFTVVAIVTLGRRNILRTVINRGTATTALTAVTTMLLRNPSKARLLGKAFSIAARFMQRRSTVRR